MIFSRQNSTIDKPALRRMLCDDRGAAAVEYGMLLAGLSLVVIVALWQLDFAVVDIFTFIGDEVDTIEATPADEG